MPRVKVWRSIRVRTYVLAVLLAALGLRFLIPGGFDVTPNGTTLSATTCSSKSKNESIEIPGEPHEPHCDHCLMPSLGPALPPFDIAGISQKPRHLVLSGPISQVPEAPLARAQTPRAPPPRA